MKVGVTLRRLGILVFLVAAIEPVWALSSYDELDFNRSGSEIIQSASDKELISWSFRKTIIEYSRSNPDKGMELIDQWIREANSRLKENPENAELWAKKGFMHYRGAALIPVIIYEREFPDKKKREYRSYLVNHPLYKEHVALANKSYQRALALEWAGDNQLLSTNSLFGMTSSQNGASDEIRVSAARYIVENEVYRAEPEPPSTATYLNSEEGYRYKNYSLLVGTLVSAHRYEEAREVLREMKEKADKLHAGPIVTRYEDGIQGLLSESIERVEARESRYLEKRAGEEDGDGQNNDEEDEEDSGKDSVNEDSSGNASSIKDEELDEENSKSGQEQGSVSGSEGQGAVTSESQGYRLSTTNVIAVGILILVLTGAGFLIIRAHRRRGNNGPR